MMEDPALAMHYSRLIPGFNEYQPDNWCWDRDNKSCDVQLSTNQLAAYFHIDPVDESQGTAGVRGTEGFSEGEFYWEVIFTEPMFGTSVMVGIGTNMALLHLDNYQYVNMLGLDDHSWGLSYKGTIWEKGKYKKYCEPFYDKDTKIGILLNLYQGTLTFFKNGINLGVAFNDLHKVGLALYPMSSSTTAETEVELGIRTSRKYRLQDKCLSTILRSVITTNNETIDSLPLPTRIREELKEKRM